MGALDGQSLTLPFCRRPETLADPESSLAPHLPPEAIRRSSLWEQKPWWCQPWSILGTGICVVALSWLGLHLWWLTAASALAVAAWWWLFLVAVPAAYHQQHHAQAEVADADQPEAQDG